jgi:hypothetical protein
MVGTAGNGQLTSRVTRRGVRFAVATADDEAELRRLLRETPMRGAISVAFEREPNYFRGSGIAGADDQTIVAFEGKQLVCMGRSATRPCWLNGEIRRVAYLGELRLDAAWRGRFDVVRDGYRFFQELHQRAPADFCFTSIAADNDRARRLLERGARGLPDYRFLDEFVTFVIPATKRFNRAVIEHEACDPTELAAFLNMHGPRTHLAGAWSADQLRSLENHGLPLECIRIFRGGGRIMACGAIWDQRSFRQTVIRGYAPRLRWMRPALNVFAALLGRPRLPACNTALAHAFVSPFVVADDCMELLPRFIAALGHEAAQRGLDYLTLGFAATDPRTRIVRQHVRARTYTSRLYEVAWPGEKPTVFEHRPFSPDVALL